MRSFFEQKNANSTKTKVAVLTASQKKKWFLIVSDMITKKRARTIQSNLLRPLFLSVGLVISLGISILSFQWKTYDSDEVMDLGTIAPDKFEELLEVPPTEQPPPPPPKMQAISIVEVPDVEVIEEEIEINLDVEITEDAEIERVIHEEVAEEEVDEIFFIVEEQPAPKGGMPAFYKYIGENIKYPMQAKQAKIQGKVFVEFVVDRDGTISNIKVVKGIGFGCDEEAARVLKESPKWRPGKQRGKPVLVRMTLPIVFKFYERL